MRAPLIAEGLGTCLLVCTVIGSGIMAEDLANGNAAVALLGNTAATGAMLYLLITIFGPLSGAHFNPAVTLLLGERKNWLPFITVQLIGAVAGAVLAHTMFGLDLVQEGVKQRTGIGQWIGEGVATFGLILTIILGSRHKPEQVPALVAMWIVAGYWFTSSTSFSNPAVTIARGFTDSFAGIRMIDVPGFIIGQFVGAFAAKFVASHLLSSQK